MERDIHSFNEVSEFVEEVVVHHSSLDILFGVFAVTALASIWFAQHSHLEALAVLLLAIALLASATCDMGGSNVHFLGASGGGFQ